MTEQRYKIVSRIAAGGMAEVYQGESAGIEGFRKKVAIKKVLPKLSQNRDFIHMFLDEARLCAYLSHSKCVQVFDIGQAAGSHFIVMEFVDGADLQGVLEFLQRHEQQMPVELACLIAMHVCEGLSYAHDACDHQGQPLGIVHRDISPHNVLLSISGEVKLADFGVARLASEETSGLHVRGKLRYMPPEQVRGQSKHATTDLFAVGAVMDELLGGTRFRTGFERDELFGMVINGEVPPLRRSGVPIELVHLRGALLTSDPNARVQSAEAALELLRRWPGYRNATDELMALVRDRAGVVGPRSGLTVEISDDQLESSDEPTHHEGDPPDNASELLTRTVRSTDASETAPHTVCCGHSPPLAVPAVPARARMRPLPTMIGVAIASLGVTLGFGYAWLHEAGASSAAPVEVAAPAVLVASAPSPNDPAPTSSAEPELVLEEAATPTKRSTTKAGPPAQVEFAASEFFFVWIKVAGRTHALEPTAKLSLPPGRHKVSLRERADQPWKTAGHVQVAAGRRYKVSLRKPHALSVQALDD
jgi:serine/threonine protein kinase